jgi:hypothetical protein
MTSTRNGKERKGREGKGREGKGKEDFIYNFFKKQLTIGK